MMTPPKSLGLYAVFKIIYVEFVTFFRESKRSDPIFSSRTLAVINLTFVEFLNFKIILLYSSLICGIKDK